MNLSFSEMFVLFILALIVFGPKRLPEIGRQIGKALAEFRRASNEFKAQLEAEMRKIEIEQALQKEKEREAAPPAPEPPQNTIASERNL
jgi:sec-independent protein translocase protein TatB